MKTILPALITFSLSVFLCCSSGKKETDIIPITGLTTLSLKLGQEGTLRTTGESAKTIKIKFRSIKEGRCATENCPGCYGGYVYAYFDILVDDTQDSFSLSRISCVKVDKPSFNNPLVDKEDLKIIRVGLADISDYNGTINEADYSVQLLISTL